MIIQSAEFLTSNSDYRKCPEPVRPEFAFIGRSNVGKSSLINMLVSRKSLAKTSGTPGKTQLINHFTINDSWYLVDLPGYGFAKTSQSNRETWMQMIRNYLLNRKNLLVTFVLIDSRISPQAIDLDFMEWLGNNQLPFVILFTKTDKLTKNELASNQAAYKKKLAQLWDPLPDSFITSSETAHGRDAVLDYIESALPLFKT